MPVGISLTLRFGLALLVTLPWLLENPRLDWNSSLRATLSGMELGMWDQAGFLTQALGMVTTKANKVSYILRIMRFGCSFCRIGLIVMISQLFRTCTGCLLLLSGCFCRSIARPSHWYSTGSYSALGRCHVCLWCCFVEFRGKCCFLYYW